MLWTISPAMATAIAREQTIDAVRERRRTRAVRISPEPDTDKAGRHRAPRRLRAFWGVHLHRRLAH